jgi:hypothetical protein
VNVGIAAAQALPALAEAALGIPAEAALSVVLSGPGSVIPPASWLAVVVLAAVAVLTFIPPGRRAGRAGPAPVLLAGGWPNRRADLPEFRRQPVSAEARKRTLIAEPSTARHPHE